MMKLSDDEFKEYQRKELFDLACVVSANIIAVSLGVLFSFYVVSLILSVLDGVAKHFSLY